MSASTRGGSLRFGARARSERGKPVDLLALDEPPRSDQLAAAPRVV